MAHKEPTMTIGVGDAPGTTIGRGDAPVTVGTMIVSVIIGDIGGMTATGESTGTVTGNVAGTWTDVTLGVDVTPGVDVTHGVAAIATQTGGETKPGVDVSANCSHS